MARPSVKVAYVNGDQTLIANLEVYKDRMTDAVADGMRKFGGRVEGESTRRCPVETGELRSRVFNEGPLRDGRHLRGRWSATRSSAQPGRRGRHMPSRSMNGSVSATPLGKRSSWRTP